MTLRSVVLPAPFGPMIATTSPRPISRLTFVSAVSAPKRTLTPSTSRSGRSLTRPPPPQQLTALGPSRCNGLHVPNRHVGTDGAATPVLVRDLRVDLHVGAPAVEGADELGVFLRDVPAAHLARAGDLLVVRVELLVEDEELADLRAPQHLVLEEAPVHARHLPVDQLVDLGLLTEVGVARIGNPPALRPVPDGGEVDVHEGDHERTVLPDADRLFHERGELELVLEVLRSKDRPARQPRHVLRALHDLQLTGCLEESGVAGVEPPVLLRLLRGRGMLVVTL